MASYKSKILA